MATHSRIAIKTAEGTIKSIYCHFDGHREVTGARLKRDYQDREKVERLISLGDLSYLEKEIDPKGEHSFRSPEKGVSVFYGRDRGESNTEPTVHSSEQELKAYTSDNIYLYENNEWRFL